MNPDELWNPLELYESVATIDSRFVPFSWSKSVYKAYRVAYAVHADRDFVGRKGPKNDEGRGERCEIKVNAGRCMTMGREGKRRRSGALISEHRRPSRLGIRASWMFN